jgi:phage terminase small subunit
MLRESKYDFQNTDMEMVDRFIEAKEIADLSMLDVRLRGVVTPINIEQTVLQKNHSISAYFDAVKQIMELSKKLGLSARDRADLGLEFKADDKF